MPANNIIVIGASMGGIDALCRLLQRLPAGFHPPIFIVQHIGRQESVLPVILNRCGPLQVRHPHHGQRIQAGQVYVAPSNQHMVLRDGTIALVHGPRENRVRPAIDPLFRSAARIYRERVIGVILSGELDDGIGGLFAIKSRGGIAIAQKPEEAVAPSMPSFAIRRVEVDHVLSINEIPAMLIKLTEARAMPKSKKKSSSRAEKLLARNSHPEVTGKSVPMVCPDCSGPLFEVKEGKLIKFNCIVGHSFSPVALSDAHADALERALWVAIRTLKEKLTVQHALLARHAGKQEQEFARRMAEDAEAIERDIRLLEQIQERI